MSSGKNMAVNEIQIALIGCGTVGTGVIKVLRQNEEDIRARLGVPVRVRRIAVSDLARERDPDVDPALLTDDVDAVLADPEVQVVIELIGGYEPAKDYILRAIAAGKHVVTANKALLARDGHELFAAAERKKVDVIFEASVAGGIPIIRSLREGLASDRVRRLYGIINGTSNFILTEMAGKGTPYEDALAMAQRLGYAEADPSMDVDGVDAAQKLSILIALGFGTTIPFRDIYTEGLSRLTPLDFAFASQFGYAIKSLAIAKDDEGAVEARVHPVMIPRRHLLSAIDGVFNAVSLESSALGPLLFYGRGAGMMPTAVSVVSDVIEVGRSLLQGTSGRLPHLAFRDELRGRQHKPMADVETEYYLRFTVLDRPGVLSVIAGVLGESRISIRQVMQPDAEEGKPVPVVILTHRAREGDMASALQKIDKQDFTFAPAQLIRVEDPG